MENHNYRLSFRLLQLRCSSQFEVPYVIDMQPLENGNIGNPPRQEPGIAVASALPSSGGLAFTRGSDSTGF